MSCRSRVGSGSARRALPRSDVAALRARGQVHRAPADDSAYPSPGVRRRRAVSRWADAAIQARAPRNTRSPCSSMILRALLTDKAIAPSRDVDVSARMKWTSFASLSTTLRDQSFGRPAPACLARCCDDGEACMLHRLSAFRLALASTATATEHTLQKSEHRSAPRFDDAVIVVQGSTRVRAPDAACPSRWPTCLPPSATVDSPARTRIGR